MSTYSITYILTTYNRLPYLKLVLPRLLAARLPDEEIVIADGSSTDGSREYLQELFDQGQIQQFVSERDRGEAHGFNKTLFMARGEIIKFISSDDAFSYPVIQAAGRFMLANPQIGALMGYNATTQVEDLTYAVVKQDPARDFNRWLADKTPFWMVGLPLMVRRSALPVIGVLYTSTMFPDLDYLYRISSSGVNIAWCTGLMSTHVSHPGGNFNRMAAAAREAEYARITHFYVKPGRRNPLQALRAGVEAAKSAVRPTKRAFFDRMGWAQVQNPDKHATGYVPRDGEDPLAAVYRACDEFMATYNATHPTEFVYRLDQELKKVLA